jgi:hypothetical protein
MSEGEYNPNPMSTQVGVYPPPYGQRSDTRTGVKIMFIAIIFAIIDLILGIFYYIVIYSLFNPYFIVENITGWIIVSVTFSIIRTIIFIIFLILMVISLYFFLRGRFEFNIEHTANVNLAKIFIIIYIVILITSFFVFPLILLAQGYSGLRLLVGLSTIATILLGFFLSFAILFLIKSFVDPRDRDLLIIFASLMILLPLFDFIINKILFLAPVGPSYFLYLTVFPIIRLFIWLFAAFAYLSTKRCFTPDGKFTPAHRPAFLPRPRPVAGYIHGFYAKPIIAFILILIIAMVFGTAVGLSVQVPDLNVEVDITPPGLDDLTLGEGAVEGTERLQEGQSASIDISVDGAIVYLEGYLTWIDEPDEGRFTNQPDRFTIEITCGNETETYTDRNPHGAEGVISFEMTFPELGLDYAEITITLEYAGDQTGPAGRWAFVSDNSNEIDYEFYYEYIDES